MPKQKVGEKGTASDQAVANTVGTSEKLGGGPLSLRAESVETVADIEKVILEGETAGEYSEAAINRQRLDRAKIAFVKTVKWVLVVAIGAALVFWGYQLNSVTKPIERISSDVRHLASEDQRLIKRTDAIGEKLDRIVEPIAKIAVDIKQLTKEDERLNKKTEELGKRLDDIEEPMERMHSDIEGLGEEDVKMKEDMKHLREEVKKGTKAE